MELFAQRQFSPNAVTSVSVLLAAAGGVAVALGRFSLGGWLYLCSGACDFLDGRLARITGKTSASGAALDSILDRYSEKRPCSLGWPGPIAKPGS